MVINIYHILSGNLLAKMDRVTSPEEAKLEYARASLPEEQFSSYAEFQHKFPLYDAGLVAIVLQ